MAKKKHTRKAVKSAPARSRSPAEKAPEYMIQVSDPKMLRKDILESLREVIIFMQGYEKFRKIQEEKVALFSNLKVSVRELNSLIDHKLRNYLPKGKLKPVVDAGKPREMEDEEKVEIVRTSKKTVKMTEETGEEAEPGSKRGLVELEEQLNEIERQLKKIS